MALADVQFKWLLSYDDNHVIEFLYEHFHVMRQPFRYSARNPKNHCELLISNFLLPQIDQSTEVVRRQRHWPKPLIGQSQVNAKLLQPSYLP